MKKILVRLLLSIPLATLASFIFTATAKAQSRITPDNSLGAERSIVTPNVVIKGLPSEQISGGATRGANLFHSFQEFNVDALRGAYFSNPAGIQNILSRVTGSNVSNIFGKLGVLGNANLFFINPNGIIFGPNASLDVNGSFFASTANSIVFPNGFEFSATNPQAPPLLTINIPIGLRFRDNPGPIQVQGDGQGITQSSNPMNITSGLGVQSNQTLALVGGDINLAGATLKTAGGRIELGSVGGNGLVSLTAIDKGFALGYSGVQNFGNIQLSQQSYVDASGEGGGDIQVSGRNLTLTGGSQIEASTLGSMPGGTLTVNASDAIELISSTTDKYLTGLFAEVYPGANGKGGNLIINTKSLSLTGVGARVDVNNFGNGNAGNLTINTQQLQVQGGAQISATTFDAGNAGNLTVNASDSVELSGDTGGNNPLNIFPSGLFAQVDLTGTGHGGNLTINTKLLNVSDGSRVQVATFGQGDAGNLVIHATDVNVFETDRPGFYTTAINAGITLDPGTKMPPQGNGGNLTIETQRLSVRGGGEITTGDFTGGAASPSTFGNGNAGTLRIYASDSVEVVGTSVNGQRQSTVSSEISSPSRGSGGNLEIETGRLSIRDGGVVRVSNQGFGNAGNLTVNARSINLDNKGNLAATSASGNGGNITLQLQDLLLLRDNSQISTSASATGNGGNITINAPFIVAFRSNNDITANAFNGRGGNITINAIRFGINPLSLENLKRLSPNLNPQEVPTSDITAISQQNPSLSGTVTIKSPDVDPSRGLVELPVNVVDPTTLIAQTPCRRGIESSFTITGRGGFPPNPNQILASDNVRVDLVKPTSSTSNSPTTSVKLQSLTPTVKRLVPAQGWIFNDKGQVILTAYDPTKTGPQRSWQEPASCANR